MEALAESRVLWAYESGNAVGISLLSANDDFRGDSGRMAASAECARGCDNRKIRVLENASHLRLKLEHRVSSVWWPM